MSSMRTEPNVNPTRQNRPDKLWYLRQLNIFNDLSAEEMEELDAQSLMRHHEPGEHVFRQGQTAAALFLLKAGNVRLATTTEDGKEVVLAVLGMGDLFGDLPLLGQEYQCCDARALTAAEVCRIPVDNLERLIKQRPIIALKLIRSLGERLSEFQRMVESAFTKTAKQRLAQLLLKLGEQHGLKTRIGLGINLRLTQQELANMIGATRESVAVLLGEMRHEGILHTANHRVILRDPRKLRQIAES